MTPQISRESCLAHFSLEIIKTNSVQFVAVTPHDLSAAPTAGAALRKGEREKESATTTNNARCLAFANVHNQLPNAVQLSTAKPEVYMSQLRLINVEEAAQMLGFDNAKRLYEAASKRLVPSVRIGRRVKFDPNALREWAARGGTPLTSGENNEAQESAQSLTATV
jgi:predicted DNA-binding transcriptional regulator AlpA